MDFEKHIKALIEISKNIHDKINKEEAEWLTEITALQASVHDDYSVLKKSFQEFYLNNTDNLVDEIFSENDDTIRVKDAWLKSGRHKLLYEDKCFPLSTVYNTAIELTKRDEKNGSYPAQILYHLYSIMTFVATDEENKKKLENNVKSIKEILPNDLLVSEGSSVGSGFSGLGKIISSVVKSAGIEENVDPNEVERMISSTIDDKMIENIGKIVSKVIKNIKNPDDIIGTITGVMQDDEVKDIFSRQ